MLGFTEGCALGAALGIPLGSDESEGAAEMVGDDDGSGLKAKEKMYQRQRTMLAIPSTSGHYRHTIGVITQFVLLRQLQSITYLMVGAALVDCTEVGCRLGRTDGISVGTLEGLSLGIFEGIALGSWEGTSDGL